MIDSDQLETQANTKQSLSNGGNKGAKNLLMKRERIERNIGNVMHHVKLSILSPLSDTNIGKPS